MHIVYDNRFVSARKSPWAVPFGSDASPKSELGYQLVPELGGGGGGWFVLKGPYDPRVPPIVKFSQESESARLTKIILSKSTVKTL